MDIKKLFPEKKISKKSLLEFLNKKGFYIVLILCIAVVGTTAVFVTTHNVASPNNDMQKMIPDDSGKSASAGNAASSPAQSSISSNPSVPAQGSVADIGKQTSQNTAVKPADQKSTPQNTPSSDKKQESSGSATSSNVKFIVPVSGNISFEYAQDKLVYSKTLEEWATHSGVDLAAERGTPVKAAADGVVSEVKSDPRLGYMVILEHANGLKTVYSNLATNDMVVPNQKIHQGDVIGSVGNSASFEVSEQPHLHFEVLKNDVPVNPSTYIPAIK